MKSLRLLGLVKKEENVMRVMHMYMALPLLPADRMTPGLDSIRQYVVTEGIIDPAAERLTALLSYIQAQWLGSKYFLHTSHS